MSDDEMIRLRKYVVIFSVLGQCGTSYGGPHGGFRWATAQEFRQGEILKPTVTDNLYNGDEDEKKKVEESSAVRDARV